MNDQQLTTVDGRPIEVRNNRTAKRIALLVGGDPVVDLPYAQAVEFAHRLHQAGCAVMDHMTAPTT